MDEKRLYYAAAKGDEKALQELHQTDEFLVDTVSYTCQNKIPLHVATANGHLPFVREILKLNPRLAEELDSQQSSPLHIASARGYVEIAEELLLGAPHMCVSRDSQGRNPLHLAAMRGWVRVLELLVRAGPISATREKVDRGMTVLHFCVRHCQLEALKILLPVLKEYHNSVDDYGDTVLHMAIRDKQIEIVKYLVENTSIDTNASNSKGQTPMSILEQNPQDDTNSAIIEIIRPRTYISTDNQRFSKWITEKRDIVMVVAILIATMAFQAGLSPPGGIWQEDSTQDSTPRLIAGESVMAYRRPRAYKSFVWANTIAFDSSLCIILLLVSGLPFKRKLFMWVLMVIMWSTVTSIAVTYGMSIGVVTPERHWKSTSIVLWIGVALWSGVVGTLGVGSTVRLAGIWRSNRFRNSVARQESA
ncbi:hypothetical protein ABFS83_08G187400 [Erythranthe nasuta]